MDEDRLAQKIARALAQELPRVQLAVAVSEIRAGLQTHGLRNGSIFGGVPA